MRADPSPILVEDSTLPNTRKGAVSETSPSSDSEEMVDSTFREDRSFEGELERMDSLERERIIQDIASQDHTMSTAEEEALPHSSKTGNTKRKKEKNNDPTRVSVSLTKPLKTIKK